MPNRPNPLRVLGLRLKAAAGVPSLAALIARFGDIESYQDFVRLVREYLPEREADILGPVEPGEQVAAFADYFEDRYFPLWPMLRDGGAEGYADLTYKIPVVCRGVGSEDYESIASDWREGYQLLTWLVENPWGTTDAQGVFHGHGPQVSLAEACEAVVGAPLLERLPAGGLPPAELHRLFDETRYKAVGIWADILHQDTGCEFLDNDESSMSYAIPPDWCREEVEHLTEAWRQGELLYNQVVELVTWLEEDMKGHFAVLVDIIEQGGAIRERNGKPEGVQLSFRWAIPETLEIPPDDLRCRLDVYHNALVLHTLDGGQITTKIVSARDLTLAILRNVPLTSNILPPDALWWAQGKNGIEVGIWRSPRVWPVAVMVEAFKPPLRMRLPMPGLVFVCSPGRPPRVYAAKKRPTRQLDPIYHAPLFNLFSDGRSCRGTHNYPEKVEEIPESFFASFFTREAQASGRSQKYPNDLFKLWEELDGKPRYPLKDLVRLSMVGDIMR